MTFGKWLLLSFLCAVCVADIFMHNPRGSNDRNCEKDVNRQNANRLFDSQNNAKGGYACPYPDNNRMYYHSNSLLRVAWTAQHGCGGGRSKCDIVLQYMCTADSDQGVRDGTPTNPNNNDGTQRIPEDANQAKNAAFGMHENLQYYTLGKDTSRNKGLFIADRNLGNGEGGATRTRQNNNGERHGFEIPEERDYYPYWRSSPWVDIAIYTDDKNRCNWLTQESENVKPRSRCIKVGNPTYKAGTWPITQADCAALKPPGNWSTDAPRNLPPPFCDRIPAASRENQLGNAGSTAETLHYQWRIPNVTTTQRCVLRIRYNVSWDEYPMQPPGTFIDSKANGKNSSIQTDPYVTVLNNVLSMKVNTNQIGRTFQDRSYVFKIAPWPSSVPQTATIVNLNVRGKRGNIVQTYPAVEYDFVPNRLTVTEGDVIHFQWVGSDYNPRRGPNDAEGGPADDVNNLNENARADRTNLVEVPGVRGLSDRLIPYSNSSQLYANTMFTTDGVKADEDTIIRLAYLGQGSLPKQGKCLTLAEIKDKNKRNQERNIQNCAKINTPSPYFDGKLVTMRKNGTFAYMCSRNNNFSNRNQYGTITVVPKTNPRRSLEQSDDPTTPPPVDPPANSDPPQQVTDLDQGLSIDNPSEDDNDKENSVRSNVTIPIQTNDNDLVGTGLKTNINVTQKAAVFEAMGVELPNVTAPPATPAASSSSSSTGSASSDDGLSSGAVAGIAVGCIFGGVLLGAILAFVFYKP